MNKQEYVSVELGDRNNYEYDALLNTMASDGWTYSHSVTLGGVVYIVFSRPLAG